MFYALTHINNPQSHRAELISFETKADRATFEAFYGRTVKPITAKEKTKFLSSNGTHYAPFGNPVFDKKSGVQVRWF